MSREEIRAKIRAILVESFQIPAEAITRKASIRRDFELESLDIVDFIAAVQKTFGYRASMEHYRGIDTFEALTRFVERALTTTRR